MNDIRRERIAMLYVSMKSEAIEAHGNIIVVYTKDQDELNLISLVQSLEAAGFTVKRDNK